MENSPDNEWDPEFLAEQAEKEKSDTARYVSHLNDEMLKKHGRRTKSIEAELLEASPRASTEEKMLLRLLAHDTAIAELLGKSELLITERVLLFVDDVKNCVALARALKQVTMCREVTTRRIQVLSQTVGVMRGQRRLCDSVPLRRVA